MVKMSNLFVIITMLIYTASTYDLYEYPRSNRFPNFPSRQTPSYEDYKDEDYERDIIKHFFATPTPITYANPEVENRNRRKLSKYDTVAFDDGSNRFLFNSQKKNQNDFTSQDVLNSDFAPFEPSEEEYDKNKHFLSDTAILAILSEKFMKKNKTHYFVDDEDQEMQIPATTYRKRRPKFKTKKPEKLYNLNQDQFDFSDVSATTEKLEKPKRSNRDDEAHVNKLNNILKRQLVKIQKKINSQLSTTPLPNEEVEDLVAEGSETDYQEIKNPEDIGESNNEVGQIVEQPENTEEYSKFLLPLKNLKHKTVKLANKFLSLFTIIQFPNSRCQATSSSSDYEGFCFHKSECFRRNGTAIGFCANGYGVCCVDRLTCGSSTNKNCTYFESPGYPNYFPMNSSVITPLPTTTTVAPGLTPDPRIKEYLMDYYARQEDISLSLSCTYRVYKTTPFVRQMRIDFLDLELRGPTNGTCVQERLIISGTNINGQIPMLCGFNTGQHVYVNVANLIGALQISILSTTSERKRHRIRICQYENACDTSLNCLQYYTGVQGTITSFNYEQSATFSRSNPGYLNNLNYAICIRREAGYCSITYRNVQNNIEYPFQLVNYLANGVQTVPVGQAGAEIFNCPDDFIVINGIRLCGYKLNDGSTISDFQMNAPVTDLSAGPIIIPVRSDAVNATGRGFKLFYTQNICT